LTIEAAPDPAIHINYGFTLYSAGEIDKANVQFRLGAARILVSQRACAVQRQSEMCLWRR